jgi:sulfate permease, SulP family
VVVLGVSLSTANLEAATQRDADFDRELRANGVANIATGAFGGLAGGMNSGLTLVMRSAGAATRFASVWASIVCFLALLAFVPALYNFPKPVLAGLLLGVGAGLLRDWLWNSYAKLPKADYALLWAIVILIVSFGLVPGVALGLVMSGLLFVCRYGRTQVVRRAVPSSAPLSNKERPIEEVAQLQESSKHAWTLTLQGYIFFGTAGDVVDTCRRLVEHEKTQYLILDFAQVQGIDVSAAEAFVRLAQVCARARAKLVLSDVNAEALEILRRSKMTAHPAVEVAPDLDMAMAWVGHQLAGSQDGSSRAMAGGQSGSPPTVSSRTRSRGRVRPQGPGHHRTSRRTPASLIAATS